MITFVVFLRSVFTAQIRKKRHIYYTVKQSSNLLAVYYPFFMELFENGKIHCIV